MPVVVEKDLRAAFGPVRNQHLRNTCMAFAGSDAHAAARQDLSPLSCEYAHYHAIRRKGSTDPESGVSLPVMAATLDHDGQPLESGWPYLKALPADLALWIPPAALGAIHRRGSTAIAGTVAEILARLDADRPVVVTMRISASFWAPDADAVIGGNAAEPTVGIHALIAVGHGMRSGTRLVLVRNSWGPGWAAQGYGWLTEDYLTPRLCDAAIMT